MFPHIVSRARKVSQKFLPTIQGLEACDALLIQCDTCKREWRVAPHRLQVRFDDRTFIPISSAQCTARGVAGRRCCGGWHGRRRCDDTVRHPIAAARETLDSAMRNGADWIIREGRAPTPQEVMAYMRRAAPDAVARWELDGANQELAEARAQAVIETARREANWTGRTSV
jgi:hypothetical protein